MEMVKTLSSASSDRHWKINGIKDELKSMQNDFVSLKQRVAFLKSVSPKIVNSAETCEAHADCTEDDLCEIQTCLNTVQDTLDTVEGFLQPCDGPGWRRVVHLDMTDSQMECPNEWPEITTSTTIRSCGRLSTAGGNCDSIMYAITGKPYSQVCGRIRGYQVGLPSAFSPFINNNLLGLGDAFVEGIVLSQVATSTENHIWTFAAGAEQQVDNTLLNYCPCLVGEQTFVNDNGGMIPGFLNGNYFCESVLTVSPPFDIEDSDPLWDGLNCADDSECCICPRPHFTQVFTAATNFPIKVSLCFAQDATSANIGIEQMEIFVR